MRIFWPDIHVQLTRSIAGLFQKLDHSVLLPSWEAAERPPKPVKDFVWRTWTQEQINKEFKTDNVKSVTKEEVLDSPPDVIYITAFENQFEVLLNLWPELMNKGSKLAFYSGNVYWPGAYPANMIKNYTPADLLGLEIAKRINAPNFFLFQPPIDESFVYSGPSDSNMVGVYCNNYKDNFPEDFKTFQQIQEKLPEYNFKLCDNLTKEQVRETVQESIANFSLKRTEGYGFVLLENAYCGRPSFLPRQYSQNVSYTLWMKENITAFYWSDLNELKRKLDNLRDDREFRHFTQERCAREARKMVNTEKTVENMRRFLENLV